MQATYQYWGARLFSYYNAPSGSGSTFTFYMKVDNAARLWVDSTLIINATCTGLVPLSDMFLPRIILQAASCTMMTSNIANIATGQTCLLERTADQLVSPLIKIYSSAPVLQLPCGLARAIDLSAFTVPLFVMLQVNRLAPARPPQTSTPHGLAMWACLLGLTTLRWNTGMEVQEVHWL